MAILYRHPSVIAVDGGFVAIDGSYSNDGDMKGLNKGVIIVKFDDDGTMLWLTTLTAKAT